MKRRLPPYGWMESPGAHRTIIRGWDWAVGAVTLLHGMITLPLLAAWLGGALGLGIWVVASLFVAAGVGWRLIVDDRGFLFSWSWYGIPVTWRRLPMGSPFAVDDDPWTGTELGEWVRLGPSGERRTCEFGSARNATGVVDAMKRAVARHHGRDA